MPRQRIGSWDCKYCGIKGNSGDSYQCKNCGKPRGQGVQFYLPVNAPVARDQRKLPDWNCAHCGAGNSAYLDHADGDFTLRYNCTQCGAPKGSSPDNPVRTYTLDEIPRSAEQIPVVPKSVAHDRAPKPTFRETYPTFDRITPSTDWINQWRGPIIGGILITSLLLLVTLGLYFALRTHEQHAQVTGFGWERTINLQHYVPVVEEDWSIPPGGRYISQKQDVHHTEKVFSHYEKKSRTVYDTVEDGKEKYVCGSKNLGNGRFEDVECERTKYKTVSRKEDYEEPVYIWVDVYATKYRYEIDKWVDMTPVRSQGGGKDPEPSWPKVFLASNERETTREEKYWVTFTSGADSYTYRTTNIADWKSLELYQEVTLKVNGIGIVVGVDR